MKGKNKLIVSTEQHFFKLGQEVYVTGDEDVNFWQRYLNVFDEVEVIARIQDVDVQPPNSKISSGSNIIFMELPEFKGISGLMRSLKTTVIKINKYLQTSNYILLRVPGLISYLSFIILHFKGKKWSVELVADPGEEAKGASNLIAKTFASGLVGLTRYMCKKAIRVSYVTEKMLQIKYPSSSSEIFSYSSLNISIDEKKFNEYQNHIEKQPEKLNEPKLVLIGRMSQPFKGVDVAIKMMAYAIRNELKPHLSIIGGGSLLEEYKQLSIKQEVNEHCKFYGELKDKKEVLQILIQSDILILPSKREGLPRAIIEAMSIGLPVVASNVAGIPELIPSELLHRPKDHKVLFEHIKKISANKNYRSIYSKQLFENSKKYDRKNLDKIRTAFYKSILSAS